MTTRRMFLRGILLLSVFAFIGCSLELFMEWERHGRPSLSEVTYIDQQNNVKMIDVLSPMARAYNNILAMLIATVGLAIPLTANMHTPKLIDMFLRDRINQVMLTFGALGAAHVLWVAYLIGPKFAPVWPYRIAVFGALAGWVFLIPYFFYVVRFLDPSNILARLEERLLRNLDRVLSGSEPVATGHELVRDDIHTLGTLVLKAIDRGDRGVATEGIWSFKKILDHYDTIKPRMPDEWFRVERKRVVGLSVEAMAVLQQERTWFEHRVLGQMAFAYESALAKAHDVVSALSDATRKIAVRAMEAGDEKALELVIRYFNNFLRESIKKKDTHAVYDLLYQYRLLACDLSKSPALQEKIGRYWLYYTELAQLAGLSFVTQLVGFDLASLVVHAYAQGSTASPALLQCLIDLKRIVGKDQMPALVKATAIAGGSLLASGQHEEAVNRLREALAEAPPEMLQKVERDLLGLSDHCYWEVTDRQINFEWVTPEQRPALQRFLASARG